MSNFYAESVFDAREVVNHPYVEYKEEHTYLHKQIQVRYPILM